MTQMYERAIKLCKRATYAGGATAVTADIAHAAVPIGPQWGGMSLTELLGIVGATVAVLGFIAGQYWAWRKASREEQERGERAEVAKRREAREAAAHTAYLRRLDSGATRATAPMPLDMCANQDDSEQRA